MSKLSLFLMAFFTLIVLDVAAQDSPKPPKDAILGLKSPSAKEVLDSIEALAAAGAKQAVDPLIELLKTGPRNDITNAAIQCLGTLADPKSVGILTEYLNHRRADTRIAAIYALEGFKTDQATRAMEEMLGDSEKEVRATAALTLGKMANIGSVPVLFKAFDRGVYDAVISIGQIGSPSDADQLSQFLGKADIKVLLPGYDEFLRRADFPEAAKLKILDKLFELAGPEVRRFALAYKASFPPDTDEDKNELYKKVSRMVRQIQGE